MAIDRTDLDRRLQALVDLLDIPDSLYEKARERYVSLGKWLHRKESVVAAFAPAVYPQGSFRLGTVVRPLLRSEEYDLDLVCQMTVDKSTITQKAVKELVGREVKAYAEANGFYDPATETNRCWRLDYADHIRFHMDILPCIPERRAMQVLLESLAVRASYAQYAVAITDRKHPNYSVISIDWPTSNPRGFADWFEERMKPAARARRQLLVERHIYASVDDVPAYDWRVPLQRAIQILKRHRDVMFKDDQDGRPISMILTTLAARAYEGEADLSEALLSIVSKMPGLVNDRRPRIPNPVDPREDFADKWHKNSRLEENFWLWHSQVQADLTAWAGRLDEHHVRKIAASKFAADISEEQARDLASGRASCGAVSTTTAPVVTITSAPRPWATDARWD